MQDRNKELTEEMLSAEYEAVYRYILSVCGNAADAQDITQDTFCKAIQSYKGFQGKCSLYTWLCTIARNLWLDKVKKEKRRAVTLLEETDMPNPQTAIEEVLVDQDSARRIHIALHRLEDPYKEVFSLRVFGELPFAQIADLFCKTESWARVTYHRAKKQILEELERMDKYGK